MDIKEFLSRYKVNKAAELLKIGDENSIYRLGLQFEAGCVLSNDKEYSKAEKWLKMAAKQGSKDAAYLLSMIYFMGYLKYEDNFEKANHYLKMLAFEDDGNIYEMLGNMFLHGKGVRQNFKLAEEYFRKALECGNKGVEYIVKIFNNSENKTIKVVKNIAECLEGIDDDIGAVLVTSDNNINFQAQTLYDRKSFVKILIQLNKRLKRIGDINPERTNELEVFNNICRETAKTTMYDNIATDTYSDEGMQRIYTSRCAYNAVLKGMAVCAGMNEKLRTFLFAKGIPSIVVLAEGHLFLQVKLEEEWYYYDFTNTRDAIIQGNRPEEFLYSEAEFLEIFPGFVPLESQFTYPSNQSYKDKKRKQGKNKKPLQNGTNNGKVLLKALYESSCGRNAVSSAEEYLNTNKGRRKSITK